MYIVCIVSYHVHDRIYVYIHLFWNLGKSVLSYFCLVWIFSVRSFMLEGSFHVQDYYGQVNIYQ